MSYNDIIIDGLIKRAAYQAAQETVYTMVKAAADPQAGQPASTMDSILKFLDENKYTLGGGAAGAGVGALFGNNLQQRLLAALLGGGAGAGLGYLGEKYLPGLLGGGDAPAAAK